MTGPLRVVVAAGAEARAELVPAIEAALLSLDLSVKVVQLRGGGVLDRALGALAGEIGARRLERELVGPPLADVALALDLPAARALARERERGVPVPVVALCEELAPRPDWPVQIDRYVCIDDEAAVALAERGRGAIDPARVTAQGAAVGRAWIEAAERERSTWRAELKLPADGPVVLIDCAPLGLERLGQLLMQLALLDAPVPLVFDAVGDDDVASHLRRQVPRLGLGGKLVTDPARVPGAWRAADAIVTGGQPTACVRALAVGAGLVLLDPEGDAAANARALAQRGAGVLTPLLGISSALLDPARLASLAAAAAQIGGVIDGADPVARLAELCLEVARSRSDVLAEPFPDAEPGPASEPQATRRPAPSVDDGLEDLGAPSIGATPGPAPRPTRPASNLDEDLASMKRSQAQKRATVEDELEALKKRMKDKK
jgi:hypothetical protein